MKRYFQFAFYLVLLTGVFSAKAGAYEDFFQAIEVDNARAVTALLARGFDPNTLDPKGQGGLHLAYRSGSRRSGTALLADGKTQVDLPNAADETPLMLAALRGDLDGCQDLLAKGAAIQRPGWSPLHYAATGPNAAAVKLLLIRGALVDTPSPNGTTPLMMAARYGTEAAVDLLLESQANPSLKNQLGLDVVDFARLSGRESLTARLEKLAR